MNRKTNIILEQNIVRAYKLLFSPETNFSMDDINNLQLSTIKAAYRNMAFQYHPDRAKALGMNEHVLKERFNELTLSYENLHNFIQNKHSLKKSRANFRDIHEKQKKENQFRKKYHKNSFTDRKKNNSSDIFSSTFRLRGRVLIGQALFYAGLITLRSLLDAIAWQREQRPQFGRIALKMNILTSNEIIAILKQVRFREKFGDCAVRLGFINSFQHRAIIAKQQKMQQPIGQYFIINRLLSSSDLEMMLQKQKLHNVDSEEGRY
ncbi:MAG: DnaJ domain-containing protein [bacterium]|nr:DnaJ domain-containing protein [bacterium]